MSTQPFDPERYKSGQQQEWDSAAAGWRKWWEVIERGAQNVNDRLVELAGIAPGQRVLDVATGIGEPALTAARMVGAGGHVVATDQSPGMLAIAQERATAAGLQNLEFQAADAENLDFPESSFDAAVCRWGLMFLPDVGAALSKIQGALVPNGKFATTVWDLAPNVPMVSVAMGVLQRELQLSPPPAGVPTIFKLGAPGAIENAFEAAGFTDVHTERMTVTIEFESAETFTNFLKEIAPPIIAMVSGQPAERQAQLWGAITDALKAFASPDGAVSLPNTTIVAVGQRG